MSRPWKDEGSYWFPIPVKWGMLFYNLSIYQILGIMAELSFFPFLGLDNRNRRFSVNKGSEIITYDLKDDPKS